MDERHHRDGSHRVATVHFKGYRVIYTLVIAVLTVAFYIPALFLVWVKRNRGYLLPLDMIFSFLWLVAFVFFAQHNRDIGCHWFIWSASSGCARKNTAEAFTFLAFFWALCCMCFEILNMYYYGKEAGEANRQPEKRPQAPNNVVP